ncbi:MAG: GDP-mannose 4,6-dehydratase [Methylotenera sp.]|jgi:GDP-4-dehydro-6-deoxy-D-mannose reductase|nr:GDP-mannose 4,6-dehydratase [Methylotenera sp.]
MTYLITGCSGFVGQYLVRYLAEHEPQARIVAVNRRATPQGLMPVAAEYAIDLLDTPALVDVLRVEQPQYVVHLASFSSVAFSWQHPIESFTNNTNIFLSLLEGIRQHAPKARVLSIGSSEEYGIVDAKELPLREVSPLRPVSPYAVARVAQEHLGEVYVRGYDLDIVNTRSFNHVGPGQTDKFVISSIAKQFAEFTKGRRAGISLGTTSVVRDFLDVRDVVAAYGTLLKRGVKGEVYNICSGRGISIADVVELFCIVSGSRPPITVESSLVRPVENPVVVGSNYKLLSSLGWAPRHTLEESIRDIYQHWLAQP